MMIKDSDGDEDDDAVRETRRLQRRCTCMRVAQKGKSSTVGKVRIVKRVKFLCAGCD